MIVQDAAGNETTVAFVIDRTALVLELDINVTSLGWSDANLYLHVSAHDGLRMKVR